MPHRSILLATERTSLWALPATQDELIRQHRGAANRLGFAVQLCLLRYPGYALTNDRGIAEPIIAWIARQIGADTAVWVRYGEREETRREHLQELRIYLGLSSFGLSDFRALVHGLTELAMRIDKGLMLAAQAMETLRQRRVILPVLAVIERVCAQALTHANRRIYRALIDPLSEPHRCRLDALLTVKPGSQVTWLVWLRQVPAKPNSRSVREHIERLKTFQALALPAGL